MRKRYNNEKKFPPYAFVPGYFPHPRSHPDGHSYQLNDKQPAPMSNHKWEESEAYLYGIDLFNFGYYWESHEEWEGLWKAAGKEGNTADFLKALIKMSAAAVKIRQGQPAGVKEHASRAGSIFRNLLEITGKTKFAGLDLNFLIGFCDEIKENAEQFKANPKLSVEIVFDKTMILS
jgi:hypothetical protein